MTSLPASVRVVRCGVSRINPDFLALRQQQLAENPQLDSQTEETFTSYYDKCYQLQDTIDRARIILYNRQ